MMIDTNIIIDLREEDPEWVTWSLGQLAETKSGERWVSAVVIGELASRGGAADELKVLLAQFDVQVRAFNADAGYRAGLAQQAYRHAGGKRERLLGDFMIGAHAVVAGEALLTRDPKRYRTYFPELTLITPESHP